MNGMYEELLEKLRKNNRMPGRYEYGWINL